jgi:hypothetical protein
MRAKEIQAVSNDSPVDELVITILAEPVFSHAITRNLVLN